VVFRLYSEKLRFSNVLWEQQRSQTCSAVERSVVAEIVDGKQSIKNKDFNSSWTVWKNTGR
jgi:hypothetical protein